VLSALTSAPSHASIPELGLGRIVPLNPCSCRAVEYVMARSGAVKRTVGLLLLTLSLVSFPALAGAHDAGPTVTITSPREGVTLASDTVTVTAGFAAAGEALVEQVELMVDGAKLEARVIQPAQTTGSLSFAWAARAYEQGRHRIAVRALDSNGQVGEVEIAVWLRREEPGFRSGIRIASPRPGEVVAGSTEIRVESERPAVVRYVIFLVDDVFKAMTNVQPFVYGWDTTRHLNGLHSLQAKAYLEEEREIMSPTVEVRVDNPSGATVMREPPVREDLKVIAEPTQPPARAGQPTMPAPMHTESLVPARATVTVAEPEVALPGTAPFISPTGELIRPSASMLARRAPDVGALQIAALPAGSEGVSGARMVSGPAIAVPASPTPEPSPSPETQTLETSPSEAPQPPASAPQPALPLVPARSLPTQASEPAPVISAQAADTPRPTALTSRIQIAMLPPRPAERLPAAKLIAEPAPGEVIYVVQAGDCLWKIAAQHGIPAEQLAQANNLSDPDLISPGQRLRIPYPQVYFDHKPLKSDAPTIIAHGRAIVPFRPVIEEAGGTVVWDPEARRASAVAQGHKIAVTIGSPQAQVDGDQVAMGAPAALRHDRTVVPLRFLGDALDLALQYQDGVIHIASCR